MPTRVRYVFDDSDREDLVEDDGPPPPAPDQVIAIDGERFTVKKIPTTTYWRNTTDTDTVVHLVPIAEIND